MNSRMKWLQFAILAMLIVVVVQLRASADAYRYGGTQVQNLIDVVNQHSVYLDELKADVNLLRADFLLTKGASDNACFGACGLIEGTNANTLKTATTVAFRIAGVNYSKAATDNIAMDAVSQQAISTYRLYLVSVNAAGTVAITGGTAVATDVAVLPALPASSAPIGYFKIVTDGSTTFTSGTTDLGAAGLTETYVDLGFPVSGTSAPTATSTAIANAAAHTLGR